MSEARSLKYPNISLSEAINRAAMIYGKEHMSTMTPVVVAEAMGYKGISGASLKTISSLKKYGLLEGRDDSLRLTKDAQVIILDGPESSDRQAAISRSALKPEVFLDIHKQFSGVGSERNIAVYLEKHGFKPDPAAAIARNYKESLGLMGGKPVGQEPPEGITEDMAPLESEMVREQPIRPRAYRLRAEGGHFQMSGGGAGGVMATPRTESLGTAAAPFRITLNGDKLHIEADLDFKTLQVFKKVLNNYELTLAMLNQISKVDGVPDHEATDDDNVDSILG